MTTSEMLDELNTILNAAQGLRIVQVQACAKTNWQDSARLGDEHWAKLNAAHKRLSLAIMEHAKWLADERHIFFEE